MSTVSSLIRNFAVLHMITLCLNIGKGAADKDGEGFPGGAGNHL